MSDPTELRSIAVHREDVVTALEATLRSDRDVVLRLTPPFTGRMRARIHDRSDKLGSESDGDESGSEGDDVDRENGETAIHVPAAKLVDNPPAYPEPDETLAELDPPANGGYDVDEHRERHTVAVEEWRRIVGESIVDRVVLVAGDEVESEAIESSDDANAREVGVLPLG